MRLVLSCFGFRLLVIFFIFFVVFYFFFFFKQKTAYEIYQCDWSSDVCSSDLHLFLEEPSCDFLEKLRGDQLLNSISREYPDKELREAVEGFVKTISEVSCEEELIDIWTEYTRLFIGVPKSLAPPYESVYRNEDRLFGDTWEKIRNWMLDDALAIKNKSVAEDHIGIELEYMMLTSLEAVKMMEDNNIRKLKDIITRQKEFMENHIMQWIPELCNDIEKNTSVEFYRALARVVKTYLEEDWNNITLFASLLPEEVSR